MDENIFPDISDISDEEVNERIDILAERIEKGVDGYPVPFSGNEQDSEKKAVCKHIQEMADAIKRVSPPNIRVKSTDMEDYTRRSWQLLLDFRNTAVFVSVELRKRICEMMLSADHLCITTSPDKQFTRFAFIVTDLWRE